MSPSANDQSPQYEFFFHTSHDLLCVLDENGRIFRTNAAFQSTLGYSESSLAGEDFARLVHPEDIERLHAFLHAKEGGNDQLTLNARFLHRELRYLPLVFSLRRIAGDTRVYATGVVAESQEPLDEWETRRELLLKIQATARVGGWDVDLKNERVYWTEETFRIHDVPFGFDPSVANGISFYAPEHQPLITEAFNACATEGKPYDLELQIVTAKGRRVWVRTAGAAVMENGKVTRVLGAFQDIDDRKRRELDLEEKLAIIEQQRSEIQVLSAPIIQVWDGVLALPVVSRLDEARTSEITARLLDAVVTTQARSVILDLTGVEAVDELTAERLTSILRAIRLLGAEGLVTGIRPAVAQTFVRLAAGFTGAQTVANLREGIQVCMRNDARTPASKARPS